MEVTLDPAPQNFFRRLMSGIYQIAKDQNSDGDERYRIGDQHITPHEITLIGTAQVSHGSWMPILQLNNGDNRYLGTTE